MTVLAKHATDDWRLYHDDGAQIGSSQGDRPNAVKMADMLNTEYAGNSMLATDAARGSYTDIVTDNVSFVDVAAGETLPWNR